MSKRKRVNHSRSLTSSAGGAKATMPVANEVDIGKGLNPWGLQRKLKADDTQDLPIEQAVVIEYVAANGPVKLWGLLNAIGKTAGRHKYQSRSLRQKLIPLTTRLCREGILLRHRSTNTIRLGPNYIPVTPDIAATRPDLGESVCDVFSVGSLTQERRPIS